MASAECDLELEDGEINDLEDGEIDEDILLPTESINNVFSRLEPRQHAYPENANSYGAIRRDFVHHNLGPSSGRWETHGGPITQSRGRFARGRTTPPGVLRGGRGKSSYRGNGLQVMGRGKSFAAKRENTRQCIEQDFCIKTSKDVSYNWPEGKYCILKHEACPYGLSGGSVSWLPMRSKFQDATVNGKQLKNVTISYCCSSKGDTSHSMTLPLEKPFYLYSLNGAKCQIVKGATLKEESVNFDRKDRRYHITIQGETPFSPVKDDSQMKLTYCYYTPGWHAQDNALKQNATTGGSITIPASQEVEKTLFTGTQLDNKTQSSGLAVAIGIGVACAMIGTASIALVTKRLIRKKSDEDDDDDEPKPDDP